MSYWIKCNIGMEPHLLFLVGPGLAFFLVTQLFLEKPHPQFGAKQGFLHRWALPQPQLDVTKSCARFRNSPSWHVGVTEP